MFVLLKVQSLQLSFRPAGVSLGGRGGKAPFAPPRLRPWIRPARTEQFLVPIYFDSGSYELNLNVDKNVNFKLDFNFIQIFNFVFIYNLKCYTKNCIGSVYLAVIAGVGPFKTCRSERRRYTSTTFWSYD